MVNWYLVEESRRVTVVDAAVPGYRYQLAAGLARLGRSESDIAAVVLTHAHPDNVGVAEMLRAQLGVPVYVHADDAERARTGTERRKHDRSMLPYLRNGAAWKLFWELGRSGGAKPRPVEEVRKYADGDELDVPGRLRVVHTPGHSAGHSSLVKGSVVFAGDAICSLDPLTGERGARLMPKTLNADTQQALRSLDRLVGVGGELLLPGHGEPLPEPQTAVDEAKRHARTPA
jgi:glyoxylase-like metal-dependent hydrolase (beta-lactamase superfamily II)